ncbi:Major facilitator superfamily MFS_1 [Bacillus cereus BDRD-ST196]|nr:Major facilitator superfamily MFS_1 [Bacillus cereus BDRD-ST196]
MAVKKLTEKLLIFKSCRIVSNKGETDVIPIRKLIETKNSASIYK